MALRWRSTRSSSPPSPTTLSSLHLGEETFRYDGLRPDTDYEFHGIAAARWRDPAGELLCRLATVNDVHFGETECGRIDDHPIGPILRQRAG